MKAQQPADAGEGDFGAPGDAGPAAQTAPAVDTSAAGDVEDIEIELFVHGLQLRHGYDFSGYARASLRRRVRQLVARGRHGSVGELTQRMLREPALLRTIIASLSVPVSEMFRDPAVFRALREQVLPRLASHPRINIWQAGCAHGEEVYSLAILLTELQLIDRCRIYATDFSDIALDYARRAIYPLRDARSYSENYLAAGGTASLSDYYLADDHYIKLDGRLQQRISFMQHNLAGDGVFCEAHLVLCRNVLIYFGRPLQDRVLGLFRDSLVRGGVLCLGSRESIDMDRHGDDFELLLPEQRILRRRSGADDRG